ncbi:agamous-like MADS-box protein AGL86 [Lycium barbarum]|uniref:agamous-like MADS-box protein AGL86 n=1 Tax=Lycium barbarum TaxID=112863 RepID=UPI00293F4328|nr:agamous-like MADS-box protein AGL86 [Lycium barbarum]
MNRKKVRLALIESDTERKASYKKRKTGFLKKAQELNTLCDVEIATIVYSTYHNEPEVYPSHGAAMTTIKKFRELPVTEQTRNMVTQEDFTKQRIKKLENQIRKVSKENRIKEFTNKMYDILGGKDIPTDMHLYDLNDLKYVINQNLNQVHEAMKLKAGREGPTSNDPQPGSAVPGGTNFEGPRVPLLVSHVAPAMVPSETNLEGPRDPLLVPHVAPMSVVPPVAPTVVPSSTPPQVSLLMFHPVATSWVPPISPLWVPPPSPAPLFSSQLFLSMVPPLYPSIPQQMALRRAPRAAPPMSPTMTSALSSSMFPPMTPPMAPSMNIHSMESMPMSSYQNYSYDIPQSSELSEMLYWDDDVMAFLDDPSFDDTNVQDPNHNNDI